MGPEFVLQIRDIVTELENDDRVKVVVFESAVDGFFLNHSDFLANFEDLTSIPQGPTGLEAWPDVLVRLTRAPFVSIALIRGRATGNGSELALACDMSFASRERALFSQWEVGVGLVAGGGPMARLPRVMGRGRALEVLLSSDDIRGADAEFLGYVNRALPDAELDDFVDALASRIASFDKWAIANTKRLVNEGSLPPRRRNQSWLGRLHGLRQATSGAGKHQSAPRPRTSEAWRLGNSARIPRRAAQDRALKSKRPISTFWKALILGSRQVRRLGTRTPRAPRAPAKSYARAYLM
jgi:enoyl-CoA hydratase/carnithine racemase